MKHTRSKNNGTKRYMRMLAILLVPMLALMLGAAAPELWAGGRGHDDHDDEEIPFDEAELFFELNNTDGDLGIHALIDGEGWKKLVIEDTKERKMLEVKVKGRLRKQGLTELFFESAEPTFDELDPADFFKRFPAGMYEIEGITLEGEELESEVLLTHVLPAAPSNAKVNSDPDAFQDDPDNCVGVDEDDEGDLPTIGGDVTVSWDPVTMAHPDLGDSDAPIEIIRYQVVAEWENDEGTFVASFGLLAPANKKVPMSVTFPESFFEDGAETKFEILVREASYNQTAIESCPFEYEK